MLKLILSLCLCCIVSIEAISVKWSQSVEREHAAPEQIIIVTEIIKGFLSIVLAYYTQKSVSVSRQNRDTAPLLNSPPSLTSSSSWLWYIPTSLLYTVSNNVTFLALARLSSTMFTLLMNLKIPMTGLLAWVALKKQITMWQWIALVLMFVGSAIACFRDGHISSSISGIMLMILYCSCSASAAVYSEYITRYRFKTENLFSQNVKFCVYSCLFNVVVALCKGTLFNWHLELPHGLVIMVMVMNGFATAAVLKFAGSIVKTYAVAFASLVTAIICYLLWNQTLTPNVWVGMFVCTFAVNLYVYDKYTNTTKPSQIHETQVDHRHSV